jgi:hypothetical protein
LRKPKKIPEGFEWDSKHKELVDVRCNNPKLKKLAKESVPAICISPFYTAQDSGSLAKTIHNIKRKKEIPWERYQHIPILVSNAKLRRMLLGKRLSFTIKHDGENVTIWKKKKPYSAGYEFVISSHNQEVASTDIQSRVRKDCIQDYEKILALIEANPTFRVVAEECAKGTSVTGIRQYPRAILYVVDIFDTSIMNFLPYTIVYQYCYHYGIPVVELYATTRHRTIKDLVKFSNHVLEYCNTEKEYGKDEGMVIKTFGEDGEYIQAKIKLDIPRPIVERIREGQVTLPQIPENEILGAISHVEADFGLDGTSKHDMPLIAKAVAEECRKHLYSSRGNLFIYYQKFMENRK